MLVCLAHIEVNNSSAYPARKGLRSHGTPHASESVARHRLGHRLEAFCHSTGHVVNSRNMYGPPSRTPSISYLVSGKPKVTAKTILHSRRSRPRDAADSSDTNG